MKQPKTKVVMLEGTSYLNNKDLADKITYVLNVYLLDGAFKLTQKPRIQAAGKEKS